MSFLCHGTWCLTPTGKILGSCHRSQPSNGLKHPCYMYIYIYIFRSTVYRLKNDRIHIVSSTVVANEILPLHNWPRFSNFPNLPISTNQPINQSTNPQQQQQQQPQPQPQPQPQLQPQPQPQPNGSPLSFDKPPPHTTKRFHTEILRSFQPGINDHNERL